MKNKEIVKRLRDSLDYDFELSFNHRKALLSYIEQLEKEKKELEERYNLVCKISEERKNKWLSLNEENEILFNTLKKYKLECESNGKIIHQLQNNRDKAIEYVEDNYDKVTRIEFDNGYAKETRYVNNFSVEILLNILKGDSDDKQ